MNLYGRPSVGAPPLSHDASTLKEGRPRRDARTGSLSLLWLSTGFDAQLYGTLTVKSFDWTPPDAITRTCKVVLEAGAVLALILT